jgi:thiamine pyrophosphate-dependent acetolactate synthase large subunit-like protein
MKKTGAWLAVHALEQLGITHTFGIPGVHNTELYDELNKSGSIRPILVTHECGGAFMADAISRTSDTVGTLVIVPAAGATHAMSGIGEAYLDGIPMLVISGGIRRDTGRAYQLHDIDQIALMKNITKGAWLAERHSDIVPLIYKAYDTATSGIPGPAFVEIPVNLQLFRGEVHTIPEYIPKLPDTPAIDKVLIGEAARLLKSARRPGLFLGWGARDVTPLAIALAERLNAPVCTTLQGLSVFPANHPLHTGMGFGNYSVPAAEEAFSDCDLLLAVGTRFSEIPTGSFGMPVPSLLIHIDLDPKVFNRNYPASVAICADAAQALQELLNAMESMDSGITAVSTEEESVTGAEAEAEAELESESEVDGDVEVEVDGDVEVEVETEVDVPGQTMDVVPVENVGGSGLVADRSLVRGSNGNGKGDGLRDVREIIRRAKAGYAAEWDKVSVPDRVNPALFFRELRRQLNDDAIVVLDDGNHTFLAAELFPVYRSKHLICPTDFNSMGYCVPAAIGAGIANPGKQVAGIVGDGAFLMTGTELLTAATNRIGVMIFVFHDGELSQISQGQEIPYSRKTCTVLGEHRPEGIAIATGAGFLPLNTNADIPDVISRAIQMSAGGQPVVVDVRIDYSKRTRFTKGVVQTNLGRFPVSEKIRFMGRAIKRKITG